MEWTSNFFVSIDYERWAMWAKAAGYPLCRACREPIAKSLWGSGLCSVCAQSFKEEWRQESRTSFLVEQDPGWPGADLGE
jgi:predicted amidophosphoribosyltransferase